MSGWGRSGSWGNHGNSDGGDRGGSHGGSLGGSLGRAAGNHSRRTFSSCTSF